MNDPDPDVLDRLLAPLAETSWQAFDHPQRLLRQLEQEPRPRSRSSLLVAALAGAIAASILLAATGGVRLLQRLFAVDVVDVQRAPDGTIESLTLRTEDHGLLRMKPLPPGSESTEPPVITFDRVGGGQVRVRVLVDGEIGILPRFEQIQNAAHGVPLRGGLLVLGDRSGAFLVSLTPAEMVLVPRSGNGPTQTLLRVAGTTPLPRYGGVRTLFEILDP